MNDEIARLGAEKIGCDESEVVTQLDALGDRFFDTDSPRLMLTFNNLFFPEVLIASSVMAEGVDLHRFCRFVIHHDLCWNPSTLEHCHRPGRPHQSEGGAVSLGDPRLSAVPSRNAGREDVSCCAGSRTLVQSGDGRAVPDRHADDRLTGSARPTSSLTRFWINESDRGHAGSCKCDRISVRRSRTQTAWLGTTRRASFASFRALVVSPKAAAAAASARSRS